MSSDGEGDLGMASETPQLLRRCLPAFLRELFDERLPTGVGWAHVFGSTLLALIGVQAFTGALLAFNYAAATDSAWESVRYIERSLVGGSLIRGMHHWGASERWLM